MRKNIKMSTILKGRDLGTFITFCALIEKVRQLVVIEKRAPGWMKEH